jgi:tripartite-type tricarboxylate transporter receptor subunit TctC
LRDFLPVSEIAAPALVLVAHPSVPARNVRELIALAKKMPGRLNMAIAGATGEIAGNAMMLQAGIDWKNIPYKGGAPATIAILSGESDMTFTNYVAVAKHSETGKLRILGISSARRSPRIPSVPTIAEGGLESYSVEMWYGLFLPAKAPAAMAQSLYRETSRIVGAPDVREKLESTGHTIANSSPAEFSEKVKLEVEKFRKIIVASKMQQD